MCVLKIKIITFSFPHMGVYPSGKDHDFSFDQCLEMKLSWNENWVKTSDYILGDFWNLSSSLKLDNNNNNNNKILSFIWRIKIGGS
jgi:hypothetical protein